MGKKLKATENLAKDVMYVIPEPLLQGVREYIATSIPKMFSVRETMNIYNQLQNLKKVKDDV